MSINRGQPAVPTGLNPVVHEWVTKALGDLRTAQRELAVATGANYDAVCYHAQQAAEKLMKAVLINRSIVVPKTHDPVQLDRLLTGIEPKWQWGEPDLRRLTHAAAEYRYPGATASHTEAAWAVAESERLWPALAAFL